MVFVIFFLFFRIKKMPSTDLNQLSSEKPVEYLEDYLFKDFNALKKFDDFLKVLNFTMLKDVNMKIVHSVCSLLIYVMFILNTLFKIKKELKNSKITVK